MPLQTRITPQRRVCREGWQACPQHQAQRFALELVEPQRRRVAPGKTKTYHKISLAGTFGSLADARQAEDALQRKIKPSKLSQTLRHFGLGARCPERLEVSKLLAHGAGSLRSTR